MHKTTPSVGREVSKIIVPVGIVMPACDPTKHRHVFPSPNLINRGRLAYRHSEYSRCGSAYSSLPIYIYCVVKSTATGRTEIDAISAERVATVVHEAAHRVICDFLGPSCPQCCERAYSKALCQKPHRLLLLYGREVGQRRGLGNGLHQVFQPVIVNMCYSVRTEGHDLSRPVQNTPPPPTVVQVLEYCL